MEQITITTAAQTITARDIENAAAQLVNIYNDARQNGGRPSGTIRDAVAALGYELTAATVATWIISKTGDGRITRRNLDFAANVPGALTLDEIRARWIYAPSDIHPAHLDQLADALREYVPEDPTHAPQEAEPEDAALTETDPAAETPAAADVPEQTAEDLPQESAPMPAASPINEELARRAKEMNSYDDYIPGSATAEYNALCAAADEIASRQKKRTDPIHHAKIDALLTAYKRRIAEYINRSNEIDARCPSWLVSGGSNFPTRKKEKQNAARDKNMEFYNDTQALLEKIRAVGMGGISADDPDAAAKIEQKLTARKELQERMKAANAAIRMKDTAAGDAKLAELGFTPKEIHDLRAPDFLGRVGFANYELSNNNAEIHRLEKRLDDLRKRAENPLPDFDFDGGHAEANADENRLQLFFDGKPSDEIRDALKKEGFRWSPRFGAWQRQLTPNAYIAVKYAFHNLGIAIHETADGDAADQTPEQAEPEQETPEQAAEPTAEETHDTIPETETDTAPQDETTPDQTEDPETTAAPEYAASSDETPDKTETAAVPELPATTDPAAESPAAAETETKVTAAPAETPTRRDLYAEITNAIIAKLEQGIIPWEKPWTGVQSGAISHTSGRAYSLINQLMLQKPGEYLTFRQCKEEGGTIRKGAKAKIVVFWKIIHRQEKDASGAPVTDENGDPKDNPLPVLRYYQVFHIDDCDGIKPRFADNLPATAATDADAETILQDYLTREHIPLVQEKGDRAYYSPTLDEIHIPLLEQFADTSEYYSTTFHEAVHSTGHKSRLDRFTDGNAAAFGSETYSKEELVAEIGAACLLHDLGISTERSLKNSAAYCQSWLRALKNDKRMIVGAAARAEKAVKMILNITEESHPAHAPKQNASPETVTDLAAEIGNALPSASVTVTKCGSKYNIWVFDTSADATALLKSRGFRYTEKKSGWWIAVTV